MGIIKGGFMRLLQTLFYFLALCCSAVILGIQSYFIAVEVDNNQVVSRDEKAIEGLSGLATLYTIFAVLLTCCLGGVSFFAFIAIVLDVCFVASMIAIAVMTRAGRHGCNSYYYTPAGPVEVTNPNLGTIDGVSYYDGCRLLTAMFALSIAGIFFFLVTLFMQIPLMGDSKKESRYGPSPNNNYTSGSGGSFWGRSKGAPADPEMQAAGMTATGTGLAVPAQHIRPSNETGYTGSTAATGTGANAYDKAENNYATNNTTSYAYDSSANGQYTIGAGPTTAQHSYPTGAATNY